MSDRRTGTELLHDDEAMCTTPRSRARMAVELLRTLANRLELIRWLLTGISVP